MWKVKKGKLGRQWRRCEKRSARQRKRLEGRGFWREGIEETTGQKNKKRLLDSRIRRDCWTEGM
jgi:hypothetical protein